MRVRVCACCSVCAAGPSVYEAVEARDHAECLSQLLFTLSFETESLDELESPIQQV